MQHHLQKRRYDMQQQQQYCSTNASQYARAAHVEHVACDGSSISSFRASLKQEIIMLQLPSYA